MSLNIIDDTDKIELGPSKDGTYTGAMGGTEMMNKALHDRVDNALLEEFNIITFLQANDRTCQPIKFNFKRFTLQLTCPIHVLSLAYKEY